MNFRKVIANVRNGQIAKIAGTVSELKQARAAISLIIDDRIAIKRDRGCLYVYKLIPLESVSVVSLSHLPRQ